MWYPWSHVRPILGRPQRVSRFLFDVYKQEMSIYRHRSREEIHDIGAAVTKIVQRLICNAFKNDAILHTPRKNVIKNITGVGGFFEQTKIIDVDEFDFIVVLPYFTEDNVKIVKELYAPQLTCKHGVGKSPLASVELQYCGLNADKLTEKKLLTNIKTKKYLVACRLSEVTKEMVDSCLSLRKNVRPIFGNTGTLAFNENKSFWNGPAMKLNLKWRQNWGFNDLDIAVDLVPAVKARLSPGMLEYITAPNVMKRKINDVTSCLLIPKNKPNISVDFMISFSQIETRLIHEIRSERPHWFYCYCILKFIFWKDANTRQSSTNHMFSSYILKSVLLQEAFVCEENCLTLADCLLKMCISLQRYTDTSAKEAGSHIEIISPWFLDSSIACRNLKDEYEKRELLIIHECLENLKNVIINIDRSKNYEYEYHKKEFLNVIYLQRMLLLDLAVQRKCKYSQSSSDLINKLKPK